jgi:C4-dicarboxylate-specific signal transduction histidine kinase
MAFRARSDLPSIGFTGAITAISISLLDEVLPALPIKPLVVLLVGLFASVLWFELLARYLRLRLRQEKVGLDHLLVEYDALDRSFEQRVQERIRHLAERNAPKKRIVELEQELDQMRAQYSQLFARIRVRTSRIIDQISD